MVYSIINQNNNFVYEPNKGKSGEGGSDIQAFTIYADMSKADRQWEKYGHILAPQVIQYDDGTFEMSGKAKNIWTFHNKYKDTLSRMYAFLPNEHIDHIVNKEVDLKKLGLKIFSRNASHNGDTVHWLLQSEEKFTVDKDEVFVGAAIRNGAGTNVSLGVDLFTLRWACKNGAIAKGRNLGSFKMAHVGKIESITKKFEDQLALAIKHSGELIKYYKKAALIKVNDEIANKIYKNMLSSNTYLPENWHIKKHKEIRELRKEGKLREANDLVKVGGDKQNLWQVFNIITEKHRDGIASRDIRFSAVAKQQSNLHKALIEVVNTQK